MNQLLCKCTIFACLFCFSLYAAQKKEASLPWITSYEEAINKAQATSKPILLFFTGSDWCVWCNKLDEEVFETKDFYDTAGDKFIFVKLDFPLNRSLSPQVITQNKQLQKKFDVTGFPTVVILDPKQQRPIGTTGYRPGGGKEYAKHLTKMVEEYNSYQSQMKTAESQKLSGAEIKTLYEKASEFGFDDDHIKLMKMGMNSDQSQFFKLERYRFLAEEGQIHDNEAVALRQQLLAMDSTNAQNTHYQLAIIDFECQCVEKDQQPADAVVRPLVSYLRQFGDKDKDNRWRLEMIISQIYFDKNNLQEALSHARSAHRAAPLSVKPEIATAITNIQARLK